MNGIYGNQTIGEAFDTKIIRLHLSHVVMLYSKQVAMLGETKSSLSYEFVAL